MRGLSINSKKGSVHDMAPAIIALVIAGIFLILGLVLLQEFRDTDVIQKASSNTIHNETTSAVVKEGGVVLAAATSPGFNSLTILHVTNKTASTIIASGNYTTISGGIKYSGEINGLFNNTVWNVTYSYKYGDVYDESNTTLVGLGSFSDFWEIIVLAMVISVVIGLLLITFGRQAR